MTDGNYRAAMVRTLPKATHLIWLDFSRAVVMRRVIWRSFTRAIGGQELWPGTGNREDFRRWLDKEHPIRWAWDTYARRQAQYEALFADPRLAHVERRRLRRPREAERLIARLAADALLAPLPRVIPVLAEPKTGTQHTGAPPSGSAPTAGPAD